MDLPLGVADSQGALAYEASKQIRQQTHVAALHGPRKSFSNVPERYCTAPVSGPQRNLDVASKLGPFIIEQRTCRYCGVTNYGSRKRIFAFTVKTARAVQAVLSFSPYHLFERGNLSEEVCLWLSRASKHFGA